MVREYHGLNKKHAIKTPKMRQICANFTPKKRHLL